MAIVNLKSERRTGVGKGVARKLRAAGSIPGVYYGRGEEPIALAMNAKEIEGMLHGAAAANVIVDLHVAGGAAADRKAIIREIQRDPVGGHILHIDLQHISLTERIVVEVPVELVGTPTGVKDGGGILEHLLRTVEVECLPTEIPNSFEVDVTLLNIGDTLHVSDIQAGRVTIKTESERGIATVVPPTILEEVVAPAAEGVVEPELVKKKEGEEAEEAEGEGGKGEGGKKG